MYPACKVWRCLCRVHQWTVLYCSQSLAEEVAELLQGTSIYLVGMMGSGKSTLGRLVGKALKYPLLDTDALIEQSTKSSISEIFAQEGEEAFRDLETDVLQVWFQHYHACACGSCCSYAGP